MLEILQNLSTNFFVQLFVGISILVLAASVGGALIRLFEAPGRRRNADQLKQQVRGEVNTEFGGLRQEMQELRSTLVEHSMSLERNMETLSRRVDSLEEERRLTRSS